VNLPYLIRVSASKGAVIDKLREKVHEPGRFAALQLIAASGTPSRYVMMSWHASRLGKKMLGMCRCCPLPATTTAALSDILPAQPRIL
jgi:hypothetical protein